MVHLAAKIRSHSFHNISNVELDKNTSNLQGPRFKFRPSLRPIKRDTLVDQVNDFIRNIRLRYHIRFARTGDYNPKLYVKNTDYKPPRADPMTEDNLYFIKRDILQAHAANQRNWKRNLTNTELNAARNLKLDTSLMTLDSEKNLGPVVVTSDWYLSQLQKHVSNNNYYCLVTQDYFKQEFANMITKLDTIINRYERFLPQGKMSSKHKDFIFSIENKVQAAPVRLNPKVQKTPVASRPIVQSQNYFTAPASTYVDEHIKPLVYQEQTVLKDTTELVKILESTKFSKNCFLVTADVSSLYTNISVDKALLALDNLCRVRKLRQCPLLVEFSKLILHNNYIYVKEFDAVYHQVHRVAMGSPFAVSIANIFMCRLECPLVSKFTRQLELYKRFIDNLFFVWKRNARNTEQLP